MNNKPAPVIWLALALLCASAAYPQGTINFNTGSAVPNIIIPVEIGLPGGPGPGPGYSAALFQITSSGLTFLPTSLTVFDGAALNPLRTKYIIPKVVEVPGLQAGDRAQVIMRVWPTSAGAFDATPPEQRAESGPLTINLGGGPYPPGDMPANFNGLIIPQIPEPRPLLLVSLAAWLSLLGRRCGRRPARCHS